MKLKHKIEAALSQVIDPETNLDIMKMQLVTDLTVEEDGTISLTFTPSSPICPLGFHLALSIQETITKIEGVTDVKISVKNYVRADELKKLLAENK